MRIAIVIGATGLVGKSLVDNLALEPNIEKIVAVTRRPIKYTSPKIHNEVINFECIEKYSNVFNGDVVFSCLGTTAKLAGTIENQREVDFEYQYKVASISSENNVDHFALVSSSGANESSRSAYLKMKGELEKAISSLPFKRISIFQPSLLKGVRENFRLGETIGNVLLPIICKLPFLKRYRPISGDEVAKKMVAVSLKDGKGRTIYQLDEIFSDTFK